MAVKVAVKTVADVQILTMIAGMIVDMTDMKTMIISTEDNHLLIIVNTDHNQDLIPTAQDTIDNEMVAMKDIFFFFIFFFLSLFFFFLILDFPKLLILPTLLKKKKNWFI